MNYKWNAVLLIVFQSLIIANFAASTLVVFLKDSGISISQILFLQAVGSLIIILLEIPTGIFADVKGRKSSLVIASLLYIFSSFIMIFASGFTAFLIALAAASMTIAFFSGAWDAILYDSIKQTRVRKLSKFFSYSNLFKSVVLGVSIILGGIIAKISYRYNFFIMTLLGVASLLIALFIKEPPYSRRKTSFANESYNIRKTMKYVINHDFLLLLMGINAIIGNLLAIIIVYLQPLLREVGFDLVYFGFVFAFLTVVQAVGGRFGSWLEGRIQPKKLAFMSIYGIAFSYSILAISFEAFTFLFSASLLSFFAGLLVPVWVVYMNNLMPSNKRATITSIGSFFNSGIFLFFAPIFGLFTEVVSMRFSIIMASVFSLLVIPILARRIKNRIKS